eukprot:UN08580
MTQFSTGYIFDILFVLCLAPLGLMADTQSTMVAKYEANFVYFSSNKCHVTLSDITTGLTANDKYGDSTSAAQWMAESDTDGDDRVFFRDSFKIFFRICDRDKDGFIGEDDLKTIFIDLPVNFAENEMTDASMNEMLAYLDVDNDGRVGVDEFVSQASKLNYGDFCVGTASTS